MGLAGHNHRRKLIQQRRMAALKAINTMARDSQPRIYEVQPIVDKVAPGVQIDEPAIEWAWQNRRNEHAAKAADAIHPDTPEPEPEGKAGDGEPGDEPQDTKADTPEPEPEGDQPDKAEGGDSDDESADREVAPEAAEASEHPEDDAAGDGAAPEPAASDTEAEPAVQDKPIDKMTKNELEAYAQAKFGVDLDRRHSKSDLVAEVKELQAKAEAGDGE